VKTGCYRKIDSTAMAERPKGSGRPRSVRTSENIKLVEELICSQNALQSAESP